MALTAIVAASSPTATPSERADSRCSTTTHQAMKMLQPMAIAVHAANRETSDGACVGDCATEGG